MGASQSVLLEDESSALLSLTSEVAAPFDGEVWMNAFRTKICLAQPAPAALDASFKEFSMRMARNAAASHNLATLCAHVALRLPKVWYFSSTDVTCTLNAVVLCRIFLQHILTVCAPPQVTAIIHAQPTPGATRNTQLEAVSWNSFVAALLDFLAFSEPKSELYDLRVQVATLLLVLLSSQLLHTDVLPAAALMADVTTPDAGAVAEHPGLAAAMAVGRWKVTPPTQDSKPAATAPAPAPVMRAQAVVAALLRIIAEDGKHAADTSAEVFAARSASTQASAALATRVERVLQGDVELTPHAAAAAADASQSLVDALASGIVNTAAAAASRVAGASGAIASTFMVRARSPCARPLAERCALLLLLLTHNARSGVDASVAGLVNPYRGALTVLADIDSPLLPSSPHAAAAAAAAAPSPLGGSAASVPDVAMPPTLVHFKSLFASFARFVDTPLGVATLYTLVHGSPAWADYVLTRSDVDDLVLPMLHQLYRCNYFVPEHVYILLITLLLFSRDSAFCETAYRRITLKRVPWYTDRPLNNINLGSFIIVLLVRALQATPSQVAPAAAPTDSAHASKSSRGMGSTSETYVHTNTLAILSNMAPFIESIHPEAAQKLMSALKLLYKRHLRFVARLPDVDSAAANPEAANLMEHYHTCVQMVLDVVSAALAPSALHSNVALLYSLLHDKKEVLDPIAAQPAFADSAACLQEVATHFQVIINHEQVKAAAAMPGSGIPGGSGSPIAAPAAASAAVAAVGASATAALAPDAASIATPAAFGDSAPAVGVASSTASISWGESEVSSILASAARTWRGGSGACEDIASSLKDSKFSYEEDARPELFFVPYVWTLAVAHTGDCGWTGVNMQLLQTNTPSLFTVPMKS